jgi:hypothetical protein
VPLPATHFSLPYVDNLTRRDPSSQLPPRLSTGVTIVCLRALTYNGQGRTLRDLCNPDRLLQTSLTPLHHSLSSEALVLEVSYKLLHDLRFAQIQALDYHLRPDDGEI